MRLDHLLSKENVGDFRKRFPGVLGRKNKEITTKARVRSTRICCSVFGVSRNGRRRNRLRRAGRGCSSAGRAPALQAGGQGFESPHLHQTASGGCDAHRGTRKREGSKPARRTRCKGRKDLCKTSSPVWTSYASETSGNVEACTRNARENQKSVRTQKT